MAKIKEITKAQVGDEIISRIRISPGKKVSVKGKVKKVSTEYGWVTYVVTGGIVDDFKTRDVKIIKKTK